MNVESFESFIEWISSFSYFWRITWWWPIWVKTYCGFVWLQFPHCYLQPIHTMQSVSQPAHSVANGQVWKHGQYSNANATDVTAWNKLQRMIYSLQNGNLWRGSVWKRATIHGSCRNCWMKWLGTHATRRGLHGARLDRRLRTRVTSSMQCSPLQIYDPLNQLPLPY